MFNLINNQRTKEQKEIISGYENILFDNIEDVIEYNIFWVFWRTSSWFTAPKDIRVVDAYMCIEYKKMIEYFALSQVLLKDKKQYDKLIKTVENDFLYTMYKKMETTMGKVELNRRMVDYSGEYNLKSVTDYVGVPYGKLVREYAPQFKSTYDQMNFIQHYSLVPSTHMNLIKEEIFIGAKSLMIQMHNTFLQIYKFDEEKKDKANKLVAEIIVLV